MAQLRVIAFVTCVCALAMTAHLGLVTVRFIECEEMELPMRRLCHKRGAVADPFYLSSDDECGQNRRPLRAKSMMEQAEGDTEKCGYIEWFEHVAKPYVHMRLAWFKDVVTMIVAQIAVVVTFVYPVLSVPWILPVIAGSMQVLAFAFSWSRTAIACFTGTNIAAVIMALSGGRLFDYYSPQVLTAWVIKRTGTIGLATLQPYVLYDSLKEVLQSAGISHYSSAILFAIALHHIGTRFDSKGMPARTVKLSSDILSLVVTKFITGFVNGFCEIFTWRNWAPVITIDVFPSTVGFFTYDVDGEVGFYRRFPAAFGGRLIELEPTGGSGGVSSAYEDKWSIVKQYNIKHDTCAESAINGSGTYDKVNVNPGASPFPFGEYSVLNSSGLYSSAGCNIEGLSVVTAHGVQNRKSIVLKGGNMKRGGVKIDTDRYKFPHPDYTSDDVTVREAAFKRFVGTPLDFAVAKLTQDEWAAIGTKALQRKDFTQQDNVEATAVFGLGVEGELYKSAGIIPRQPAEVRKSGYILHKVSTERGASGACINVKVDNVPKKAAFHVARPEGDWIDMKNVYNLAISFSVIWSFLYEEGLVGDTVYDSIKGMLRKYQGHVDTLPDSLPDDGCGEETPWANYHREWENSADIQSVREQIEEKELWEGVRQDILNRTVGGSSYDNQPVGKRAARGSGDEPECRDSEILLDKLVNSKRDLEGKHMRLTIEGVMSILGMTRPGVKRVINMLISQNLLDTNDERDSRGVRVVTYGLREYAPFTTMPAGRSPNQRRKLVNTKHRVDKLRLQHDFSRQALALSDGFVRCPCIEESKPAFIEVVDGQHIVLGQTRTVIGGRPLNPDAPPGHVAKLGFSDPHASCPGEAVTSLSELAWTAAVAVTIPIVAVCAPLLFESDLALNVINKSVAAASTVVALRSYEASKEAAKQVTVVASTETETEPLAGLEQELERLSLVRAAANAAAGAAEEAVRQLLALTAGESLDDPAVAVETTVSTAPVSEHTFFNGVPTHGASLDTGAEEIPDAIVAWQPDVDEGETYGSEDELFDELNTERDSQTSTCCPLDYTIKEMQAMLVQGDTSFGPNLRERNVAEMHETLISSDEFKLYRQYMTAVLPTPIDTESNIPKQDEMLDQNGHPFFEHVATFLDSHGRTHSTIPEKKKKRAGVPTEETSKRIAAVDALLTALGADVTKPWVTPVNDWTTINQTMRAHSALGVATAPTATPEEWQAAYEFGVSVFDTSPLPTTLEDGVRGMHCVLQGLADASSGVSQRFHNQNKRGWFTNAEYCRDLVDLVVCRLLLMQLHRDVIHTYDHGDLLNFGLKDIIVLTTKSERHKPSKAEAGRWRMIWVCSIVDCVVQKLLHKASNSRDIENYQSGKFQQSAAGMGHDPESMNHLCWSIEKLFGDDDNLVTCDATMFDMTMGEQAHLNHGRRRCLSVENDEVKGLIMSLAHINTRHICENKGYVWRCNKIGANASGQSSTTHDNGFTRVSEAGQAGSLRVIANGDDMVSNDTIDIKQLDKFGVMSRDVVIGDGEGGPSRIVPFTSHHIDRDTRTASYDRPEKLAWNLQDNIAGQEFPQRVDALIELLRDTPEALALFVEHMTPWHSAKRPNTTVVVPDKFAFKL